jgi:O-antigen/teichoic acid export membrane protein
LLGNIVYVLSQWCFLVVLSKYASLDALGSYAVALAVIAPTFALTNGGLRTAQATDVKTQFCFSRYLGFRLTGNLAALVVILLVAALGAFETCSTVGAAIMLWVARSVEGLSDVVHGQMQRAERLEFIGQSLILRGVFQIAGFSSVIVFGCGLEWALLANATAALAIWVLFDMAQLKHIYPDEPIGWALYLPSLAGLGALAVVVMPFSAQVFINVLFQNIPRYFVQWQMDQAAVGIFTAVVYSVSAGAIVINALGQSALPRLSRLHRVDGRAFVHLLLKLLAVCGMACVLGVSVVYFFGANILVLVYSNEFSGYGNLFLFVALFASALYISVMMGVALTAARAMRGQIIVNLVSLVALSVASWWYVPELGLEGGALAMILGALVKMLGQSVLATRLSYRLINEICEA